MGTTINVFFGCKNPRRKRPRKPTNLWVLIFERDNVAAATVTLNWTPSVTPTVKSQLLQITVNSVAQPLVTFADNTTATYVFQANELDVIHAELWANDGKMDSAHAAADLTIPEITAPAPPTNLTATWVPTVPPTPPPGP